MAQDVGTPTQIPPGVHLGDGGDVQVGTTRPTISDAAAAGVAEQAPLGPIGQPPTAGVSAAVSVGAATAITGAWHNGLTVDALWSVNEPRNAFMHVVGVGWKKIYNGTDAAFTALTTLASQARQTGRSINYRDEADGMVHEIYLW